jgi:thiol-disulfide isomerase/thioredoxin
MNGVNRRHAITTLTGAALGPAAWVPLLAAPAAAGEPVQWPEVTLLDGTRWTSAQADGKAVVVVFWSTTCPFCRRHNAHVEKLRQAAADKPLEIVTVAREHDPDVVRQVLARNGWRFGVTLDSRPMAAIPLTVTVDRRGRLKQVIPGEMFEDDVLGLQQLTT